MVDIKIKDSASVRVMIAEKGHSLRSYANKIGISHTYLSQILNSKKNPSAVIAHKIASGLGLKIEDIFLIKTVDAFTTIHKEVL